MINERKRIDLAVNEVFDLMGVAIKVVEDKEGVFGCEECVLNHTSECPLVECAKEFRTDFTEVHYEKSIQ